MNKTILSIKVKYDEMGRAEKKIADWIFENPNGLVPLSITELAEKCKCSEATVVRFSKRLGFSGYQELKISIARESNSASVNEIITADDNCDEVFKKIIDDIYCSLEMTQKVLKKSELQKAAHKIMDADKIIIAGVGNSASVILDLHHKLLRCGLNAVSYSDNHMQAIAVAHTTEKDVVIGVSLSGSSKDIVDTLKSARENGATTIAITNAGKSPILKHSDIVLCTSSDELRGSILGLNSRVAQLAIINSIYCYILFQKGKEAEEATNRTEQALINKKY